jgi:hypothetical protein
VRVLWCHYFLQIYMMVFSFVCSLVKEPTPTAFVRFNFGN